MTSGGARVRSGPPPDPSALRRDRDGKDWTILPAAGRSGPVPEWPLARPNKRELALWEQEWRRPQAIMWEKSGQELEVGMYVRTVAGAEQRQATAAERNLVLRMMDSLGISSGGMARNLWKIEDVNASTAPAPKPSGRQTASAKDRLRVMQGGAAS